MAFKTVEQFNEEKYRNKFVLQNDKDSADVVFLYRSLRDMLIADVHYLKAGDFSGYVHCVGNGCPICAMKKPDGKQLIRKQTKLFIPLYNINKVNYDEEGNPVSVGAIEFWDRTEKFRRQFTTDVFDRYSNPSEVVYKVIRHGVADDKDTRYELCAMGRNVTPGMSYNEILARFNATMPDYYETIVKSCSISELTELLQTTDTTSSPVMQDYVPTPRAGYQSSIPAAIPDTYVNAAVAVGSAASEAPDAILSQFDDDDTAENDSEDIEDTDIPAAPF